MYSNLLLHHNREGVAGAGGSASSTSYTLRNSIIYASSGGSALWDIENETSIPETVSLENVTLFGTGASGTISIKNATTLITVKNTLSVNHGSGREFPTTCNAASANNLSQYAVAGCAVSGTLVTPADTNQASGNYVVFNACPTGAGSCTAAANTYDLHLRAPNT